jgi:uncharacterized protein YegJ (DUF2314 family)
MTIRETLDKIIIIAEYLEDMRIYFESDIEDDNYAEMQLITGLSFEEVAEILSYLFK